MDGETTRISTEHGYTECCHATVSFSGGRTGTGISLGFGGAMPLTVGEFTSLSAGRDEAAAYNMGEGWPWQRAAEGASVKEAEIAAALEERVSRG